MSELFSDPDKLSVHDIREFIYSAPVDQIDYELGDYLYTDGAHNHNDHYTRLLITKAVCDDCVTYLSDDEDYGDGFKTEISITSPKHSMLILRAKVMSIIKRYDHDLLNEVDDMYMYLKTIKNGGSGGGDRTDKYDEFFTAMRQIDPHHVPSQIKVMSYEYVSSTNFDEANAYSVLDKVNEDTFVNQRYYDLMKPVISHLYGNDIFDDDSVEYNTFCTYRVVCQWGINLSLVLQGRCMLV
jgi:hypothetical protein